MNISRLIFKKFPKNQPEFTKRMTSVLVFSGKGSKKESRHLLLNSLKDTVDLDFHDVRFISATEVKEGDWMSHARAICLGGGYDLGFIESLGPSGMRKIREFVAGGGSYLGLCAGAYFACDFIEFDKNGPLEVVGERSLKFYQGKCIGPTFPGFDYNSRKGAHAVPVIYQNSLTLDSYMEGGGYFLPYNPALQTGTEVLGRYETLENVPAAVVRCKVGQGSVILSGVHLEFSVHELNHDDKYLRKLLPHFFRAEDKRKSVFKDMLTHLGIKCHNVTHNGSFL